MFPPIPSIPYESQLGIVKEPANLISGAAHMVKHEALDQSGTGLGEDEVSYAITERLDAKLNLVEGNKFEIHTKKVDDNRSSSPETVTGADMAIAIGILTNEETWGTGIIAQAKSRPQDRTPSVEDLKEDCEKMLSFSSTPYCLMYSEDDIYCYPAHAVQRLNTNRFSGRGADELHERLPHMTLSQMCFSLTLGFTGDDSVYQKFSSIINPIENPISSRGIATDGGQENVTDTPNVSALLILAIENEYRNEHEDSDDDLLEDTPFESDGPFSDIVET